MFSITFRRLIEMWNNSFLVISVLALAVDPLFYYVPILDGTKKCLDVDRKLLLALCIIRALLDLLSILHIITQLLTRRSDYLRSELVIDLLASLPAPQAILMNIHNLDGSSPFLMTNLLKLVILCHFIVRVIRLKLIYKKVANEFGLIFICFSTEGAGLAFFPFWYLLASHVVGSLWYLLAIEWKLRCWRNEIKYPTMCDYSMFVDAPDLLETRDLPNKILYCSLWGLENLSSFGEHLNPGMCYEEILFAYFIVVIGLFLFHLLLYKMQAVVVRILEDG